MRALGLVTSVLAMPAILAGAAAGPPEDAVGTVRVTLSKAHAVVLADESRDEKLVALRVLARQLIDTREMGRRAIGARLSEQPEAQQEEFLDLFDEVIVRSYLQRLLFFRRPRFAFDQEEAGQGIVTVHTRILTERDEFLVDYEMHQRDGGWVASDVVIEGMSLTHNYAQQFNALLRTRSFGELLEMMRGKLVQLRAENPS
jgi:phospholipid transport system substrate-binding protein